MNILALEPYYGGSHKQFLDALAGHSRHDWSLTTLPAYKWKWRMRHSALTLAEETNSINSIGEKIDLIFCSDMLNLAEYKGLLSPELFDIPTVLYFHENQLTYPMRYEKERDLYFGMVNYISALAADTVMFNSHFHMTSFYEALQEFLKKMPDYQDLEKVETAKDKSAVFYPGIENEALQAKERNKIPTILWSARWEHDKNPEMFFEMLYQLQNDGIEFKLNIIGQSFENSPTVFAEAKEKLSDRINRYGFLQNKDDYLHSLRESDILISTANHEFYGISILEAVKEGVCPLLPNRLSYPELFDYAANRDNYFYENSPDSLLAATKRLLEKYNDTSKWNKTISNLKSVSEQFLWKNLIDQYDASFEQTASKKFVKNL